MVSVGYNRDTLLSKISSEVKKEWYIC